MYVPTTSENSIWVNVKVGENENLYIGTIYISPSKGVAKEECIDELFKEANSFTEKGMVIIQGNINVRTSKIL